MGINIPFVRIWIISATIALSILLLLKLNYRWYALVKVRKSIGYKISLNGWRKSLIDEIFKCGVLYLISILMLVYYKAGLPVVLVLFIYLFESSLHLLFGKRNYKIIIRSKTIMIITNNIIIIKWSEIKSIVKRHNDFQFKQNNNIIRLLDVDLINEKERDKFNDEIRKYAIEKNIFIKY